MEFPSPHIRGGGDIGQGQLHPAPAGSEAPWGEGKLTWLLQGALAASPTFPMVSKFFTEGFQHVAICTSFRGPSGFFVPPRKELG